MDTINGFRMPSESMSKQIRIMSGLHAGALSSFDADGRQVVGSDAACSVVLLDEGIAARHCAFTLDAFGATCRALDSPVVLNGSKIPAGAAASVEDYQLIECGPVVLSIGPAPGDWTAAEKALHTKQVPKFDAASLKRVNPYVLFACVLAGMVGVLTLAYAALSESKMEMTPTLVEHARQWLKSVSPSQSELAIGIERNSERLLLLSGYVMSNSHIPLLATAAQRTRFKPRLEVYAVDDMLEAVARMSHLVGVPCEAQYRGGGQIACTNTLVDESSASKLRSAAKDVPGLRELGLQVALAAPLAAAAPAARPQTPAQLTQKFSVLIYSKGRYLIGRHGQRYAEGERFDGFTINRIAVDKVTFERDGNEYEFYVAALGAR